MQSRFTSLLSKQFLILGLILGFILCLPLHGYAKPIKNIESFGVYAASKNGFIKVRSYKHYDRFVTFNHLKEVPQVTRKNKKAKFVIYSKDFKQSDFAFAIRPIEVDIKVTEIDFDVKPLRKKNMYEITLADPVPNGHMVHVYSGEFFSHNMGVVMLGNTQKELVKYFSRKDLKKAYAVVAYLEDSLKAYPKNKQLKTLLPHWQKAAKDDKDVKAFAYIDEEWRKYHGTEKLHLKVRYLRSMIGEVNAYLRDHPDGMKVTEAKSRKAYAEKKIKEFDPKI